MARAATVLATMILVSNIAILAFLIAIFYILQSVWIGRQEDQPLLAVTK